MNINYKTTTLIELTASNGCTLRRKGSDDYQRISKASIAAAQLDNWEEIPIADLPRYTAAEYAEEVERLIRERYSVSAELAILRQQAEKPDEYAAYYAYAEECKAQAKTNLNNRAEEGEGDGQE
ncbi:MAG: hypothetical protein ACI30W_02270 [Muribaculaceae bacterium]